MKIIPFSRASFLFVCALFLNCVVHAEVVSQVNVHGELFNPTTETVGGIGVLTAQIGPDGTPKTATEITAVTRTISAWTIASAEDGRLAFHLISDTVVPAEAPSARLSAFVQSTNNRVIDRIYIGPGMGPGGPVNEGDIVPVVAQVRLDARVQQQGRPSGAIQLAFTVRAGSTGVNLPVIAEYDSGGLNPPQDFEVHEEWDLLIDVEVGGYLSYDALMSGWILGTAFDPGTAGTNFILIDPLMRIANAPGYDLELTSEAGALTTALPMSNQFDDVMPWHWAYSFIETLADSGITSGCGDTIFCPADPVTRAQMAVFLERGINGANYDPPTASGNVFLDVAAGDFAAAWIEQLFADGITAGCGNNNYCPNAEVTRDQMAVFLLRAKHGSGYSPPAPTGVFADVDLSHWACAWIEQLAAEGITAGCGDGNYCPGDTVNRDQMAVFLVRTFGL